jgi:hypothetical protein
LPGAWVDLNLVNGTKQWAFSGITDSEGLALFTLTKPPSGTYVATMANLTLSGFEWDTNMGITSATYVPGDSAVKKVPPGKAKK